MSFRIGIAGCGSVADFGHAPAIAQNGRLHLAAVYDPQRGRAEAFATRHGAERAFDDFDAFIRFGLDALVICSPPAAHEENALAAIERGIPVLCEKPISHDEPTAIRMREAARRASVPLLIGFVYRFSPVATQIREWVRGGIIGKVRSLRLIYIWDLHGQFEQSADGHWAESPRWRGRMLEGGPLVDCGVHQIDLARWWLDDEPVRWSGFGARVADGYEAPDHVYLHMDHLHGAHTMIETSFTYGHTAKNPAPDFSYHLVGSGGVIRYFRDGYALEARTGDGVVTALGASEKNFPGMYQALAHFLATGDAEGFPTADDGIIATRIAVAATHEAEVRLGAGIAAAVAR